jgi:phytoene synthase
MAESPFQPTPIVRGSSLYYALLYASFDEREAVRVLFSFYKEMKAIVQKTTEPQVAKMKLAWWSQEITRIEDKKPQHPLSHLLAPVIARYQLQTALLQDIIAGMLIDLDHKHFSSTDELINFCSKIGGAQSVLFSQIFVSDNLIVNDFALNVGIALQLILMIRNFGKDFSQGKHYFPVPSQLLEKECAPEDITMLLTSFAKLAHKYYLNALEILPTKRRYAQLSLLILAKIDLALLNEMERDHFRVINQKYSLTPLRKLWIAWRTHSLEKNVQKNSGEL